MMKFNLKNRPMSIEQSCDNPEIDKWFEGFEKELRKKLAKYADQRHTSPNNSAYLLMGMEGMIKEILG